MIRLKIILTATHGFSTAVGGDLVDFWAMCREIQTKYILKFFLQCFQSPYKMKKFSLGHPGVCVTSFYYSCPL